MGLGRACVDVPGSRKGRAIAMLIGQREVIGRLTFCISDHSRFSHRSNRFLESQFSALHDLRGWERRVKRVRKRCWFFVIHRGIWRSRCKIRKLGAICN